jgi:hypothetical protein
MLQVRATRIEEEEEEEDEVDISLVCSVSLSELVGVAVTLYRLLFGI